MLERRNVVSEWLSTSDVRFKLRDFDVISEGDIEGAFEAVENNGSRLHEVQQLGRFLDSAQDYMPAAAYFRFAATLEKADAAQSLYPDFGIPSHVNASTVLEGGLTPFAYANALNLLERKEFPNSMELMFERAGFSAEDLGAYQYGMKIPDSYADAVITAAELGMRPWLVGLAYLSDKLFMDANPDHAFKPIKPVASRRLFALINSAGEMMGLDKISFVPPLNFRTAVDLAHLANYAGFEPAMVHDAVADYFASPTKDYRMSEADVDRASDDLLASGKADRSTTLYAVASNFFEKRADAKAAERMSDKGARMCDRINASSRHTREALDKVRADFAANSARIAAGNPFTPKPFTGQVGGQFITGCRALFSVRPIGR